MKAIKQWIEEKYVQYKNKLEFKKAFLYFRLQIL